MPKTASGKEKKGTKKSKDTEDSKEVVIPKKRGGRRRKVTVSNPQADRDGDVDSEVEVPQTPKKTPMKSPRRPLKLKLSKSSTQSTSKSLSTEMADAEVEQQEEDEVPESTPRRKSTPRNKQWVPLEPDEEESMVNFLKDNPCIYNKKLKDYRDKKKKERLWEEQAASLGRTMSVEMLMHWFESMRTRYGRITKEADKKKKSGAGGGVVSLTERDTWIVQSFAFLAEHIVRVHGNPCVSLKARISAAQPSASRSFQPLDTETETEDEGDVQPVQQAEDDEDEGQTTNMQAKKAKKTKRRRRDADDDEEVMKILRERRDASIKVQEQLETMMQDMKPSGNREGWVTWMKSSITDIDDEYFLDFQQESFQLFTKYLRMSKQKRSGEAGTSGTSRQSTPAAVVTQVTIPPPGQSPSIATLMTSTGQQILPPPQHHGSFPTIDPNTGVFSSSTYSSTNIFGNNP